MRCKGIEKWVDGCQLGKDNIITERHSCYTMFALYFMQLGEHKRWSKKYKERF